MAETLTALARKVAKADREARLILLQVEFNLRKVWRPVEVSVPLNGDTDKRDAITFRQRPGTALTWELVCHVKGQFISIDDMDPKTRIAAGNRAYLLFGKMMRNLKACLI
jgi:hypothetical protein